MEGDTDPLGVILQTRAMEAQRKKRESNLMAGPNKVAPSRPSRTVSGGISFDRDIQAFFSTRPIDALPSLSRLKLSSLPETEDTVKHLIASGQHRKAIQVAKLLLDTTPPKENALRHRLRQHLGTCFLHLHEFKDAKTIVGVESEGEPLALRILRSEIKHYLGDNDAAIRGLCNLRTKIQSGEAKLQPGEDVGAVNDKIIAYLNLGGKFQLALRSLSEQQQNKSDTDPTLYVKKAKLLLKLGDVSSASLEVKMYENAIGLTEKPTPALLELRALLLVVESKMKEAMGVLAPLIQGKVGSSMCVDAVNNYAVCALLTNQIQLAIDTLEDLVRRDPFQGLNMAVVRNLVALYDLCSLRESKQLLRKLVDQYAADSVAELCRRANLW